MFGAIGQRWKEARAGAILESLFKDRYVNFFDGKRPIARSSEIMESLFVRAPVIRDKKRFGHLHGEVLALVALTQYIASNQDVDNRENYLACVHPLWQIIQHELGSGLNSIDMSMIQMCTEDLSPFLEEYGIKFQ